MNNIIIGLKRFLMNKNIVTVICVIVILGLLYWGYTSQINSAVAPVSVPVANTTIQPRTEITDDMIDRINIPSIALSSNVITSRAQIVGKYSAVNTVIPEGSMFYKNVLVEKQELPDSAFADVKDGEIPYQFPVTLQTTYGNSIFPKTKIDIYMKAENDEGLIMVGRLLENVEVLAVKDSSGNHVFENSAENRTPAYLIFGLPEKIHIMLRKAEYLRDVELFPVPHGGTVPIVGDMEVDIEELQNYIESRTVNLLKEELEIDKVEDKDKNNEENQNNSTNLAQ